MIWIRVTSIITNYWLVRIATSRRIGGWSLVKHHGRGSCPFRMIETRKWTDCVGCQRTCHRGVQTTYTRARTVPKTSWKAYMSNQRAPILIEATGCTEPHLCCSRPHDTLRLGKRNFVDYLLTPVPFINDQSFRLQHLNEPWRVSTRHICHSNDCSNRSVSSRHYRLDGLSICDTGLIRATLYDEISWVSTGNSNR